MSQASPAQRWKTAIVWGAGQFGQPCLDILGKYPIQVQRFVDRTPPPSGEFLGFPVSESQAFIADSSLWAEIDVIIFAMLSDSMPMQAALREAGYQADFSTYHNGMTEAEFFTQRRQLFPREILRFDHGDADRRLLEALLEAMTRQGRVVIHGANQVTDYLFALLPGAAEKIAGIADPHADRIDPARYPVPVFLPEALPHDLDTLWISSTAYLDTLDATHLYANLNWQGRLLDWTTLARELPEDCQPVHAYRDTQYHIYPIDIPQIHVEPGLDFLLIDLPARFLGLLPNGLGYVHNILNQIDCRSQTVDLDMIFYHRYHARRLLDAEPELLSPNGKRLPLDPWGVTTVEDFWFDQDLVNFFRAEIDQVATRIAAANPKMLGISLHSTNRLVANEIIARMRQACPEMLVIVGGYDCNNPKTSPNVIEDYDYMVIFEAENSLPPLVNALLAGKRHFHIPGVISRKQYLSPLHTPYVPAELPEDLDAVGFPKYEWSDIRLFRNYNGYQLIPITLSRGCRWSRCNFCGERFHWRRRSPKSVADEIEWFAERGGRLFHFNDSDLSGDPDAVRGVCEEIVRRNIRNINMLGQLRVQKGYTREYFDVLRAAGFNYLRYGIDGWSKNTLKLHKKGYTLGMIQEVLGHTKAAGISVAINLVIGIPGETEADIDETITNLIENRHLYDVVENLNTLILTTASVYWTDPEKFGIVLHADKEQLERDNPVVIPIDMWHSEGPFIDQDVRRSRLIRMLDSTAEYNIKIGGYADRRAKSITDTPSGH